MVWYSAGNESPNRTDLSGRIAGEKSGELIQRILPKGEPRSQEVRD